MPRFLRCFLWVWSASCPATKFCSSTLPTVSLSYNSTKPFDRLLLPLSSELLHTQISPVTLWDIEISEKEIIVLDDFGIIAQIIEAALLPLSLIYLAREAQLNVKLTKAQFSHTLTNRLYERYLSSTQNQEFVSF